ncbi:MAG: endo-1,4-beta-xylanase [Candidatus Sulfotelmatobacter sp.]
MRNPFRIAPLLLLLCVLLMAQEAKDTHSLRYYADKTGFWVGCLIQGKYFHQDPEYRQVLGREFNLGISIVLMRQTQPERGRFNFAGMDRDRDFARAHDMKLFGQALVYRNDNSPDWLRFDEGRCGGWSANELDQILKEQIETVVGHGGDTFYGWEVVNEPLDGAHNGCWSKVLGGEEVIAKAFRYAREASPQAVLLLNETFGRDGVNEGKVDEFFRLVTKLKRQGVPIDAVGIEMHLEAQLLRPTYVDEFKYFLAAARKAGVEAQVTEMDVYQGPPGAFPDPFAVQKQIFYNIAHTCLQDSNCKGFSVWGLGDRNAWHPQFRGGLSDTAPLLFDENYNKKPAYFGLLEALKQGR